MHDFILFRSTISGLLCSMWRSVWVLKLNYSLCFSESLTGSGLWSYQFAVLSKPHFPLRSHWITWATSSWLYDLYFYSLSTYSACLGDILIVNKNALSSVESRLLWDSFCCQLVMLLFRWEYIASVISHNVNFQNVKFVRRERTPAHLNFTPVYWSLWWKPFAYWLFSNSP